MQHGAQCEGTRRGQSGACDPHFTQGKTERRCRSRTFGCCGGSRTSADYYDVEGGVGRLHAAPRSAERCKCEPTARLEPLWLGRNFATDSVQGSRCSATSLHHIRVLSHL